MNSQDWRSPLFFTFLFSLFLLFLKVTEVNVDENSYWFPIANIATYAFSISTIISFAIFLCFGIKSLSIRRADNSDGESLESNDGSQDDFRKKLFKNISNGVGWNSETFAQKIRDSDYSESEEAASKIRQIDQQIRTSRAWRDEAIDLFQLRRLMQRVMALSPQGNNSRNIGRNVRLVNAILFDRARRKLFGLVLLGFAVYMSVSIFGLINQRFYLIDMGLGNLVVFFVVVSLLGVIAAEIIVHVGSLSTEKTSTHFDDLVLKLIGKFLPVCVTLFALVEAIDRGVSQGVFDEIGAAYFAIINVNTPILLDMVIAIVGALFFLFVWRHFAVQLLRIWARRTHQKYDDVFVEILSSVGNLVILTIAYTIFVNVSDFEIETKALLNRYAIGFVVLSGLIGWAGKQTIENFFSGLVLQVDRPFDIGDRLVLPTGEICDVRQIGMRSVTLYDVLANTELSVPNTIVSTSVITNISRPDSQLRLRIPIYVSLENEFEKEGSVQPADRLSFVEAALLFIAYYELEISIAATREEDLEEVLNDDEVSNRGQLPTPNRIGRRREDLRTPLARLSESYEFESLPNNPIDKVIGSLDDFETRRNILKKAISDARSRMPSEGNTLDSIRNFERNADFWIGVFLPLANHILDQSQVYGHLEKGVLGLKGQGDSKRIRAADLEPLLNELEREPSVHSHFLTTSNGEVYAEVVLNCFAANLERRYEVSHLVHRYVETFFKRLGIGFVGKIDENSATSVEVAECFDD